MSSSSTGVLLVNLGTPDAPTARAVRIYLAEFLHDRRVVDITRWVWCPVLHGIILRTRPKRVAKLYQSIWTDDGAPLLAISKKQQLALQQKLQEKNLAMPVALAMNYGNPSIAAGLNELKDCEKVIVLPLYPQYSSATTASVFDRIAKAQQRLWNLPDLCFIKDYHQHPQYIKALAASVRRAWSERQQPDVLMMSFHGIPKRYATNGDPYPQQCQATAQLLANELGLTEQQWQLCFQSRFGREEWLQPYTDKTLAELAKTGQSVDVICPGFSADCLETLEEIEKENKQIFLENGGQDYHYIPCLNDDNEHIEMLFELVMGRL